MAEVMNRAARRAAGRHKMGRAGVTVHVRNRIDVVPMQHVETYLEHEILSEGKWASGRKLIVVRPSQDVGAAVLTALPFGRNSLFKKAAGRPLPDFAAEFGAKTWAQFFLKFLLAHPAVTAVIPGTDKPEYMADNLQAGRGLLPDAAMRKRMVQYWEAL